MSKVRRPSRFVTPLWISLFLIFGCGCGGAGVLIYFVNRRAEDLPNNVRIARAAGLAVSVSDLKVSVKPADDALPDVQRAVRELSRFTPSELFDLEIVGNEVMSFVPTPAAAVKFRRYDARLREFKVALERAGKKPRMSVTQPELWNVEPAEKGKAIRENSPGYTLSMGVLLIAAEAVQAAQNHRVKEAVALIQEGQALLPHLEAERTYAGLVRRAWAEIRLQRALVRTVQANPGAQGLWALRKVESGWGPLPSAKRSVAGDLALALDATRRRKHDDLEYFPFADALRDLGRSDLIRIFTAAVKGMPGDPNDLDGVLVSLDKMRKEASEAPIYGGYAIGYRGTVDSVRDVLTRRRLARIAAGILTARLAGKPTPTLASFGSTAIDPHTGKSFREKKVGDRLLIYSLGRDGLDDTGKEQPKKRLGIQTRDIVLAIPGG